MPFEMDRRLYQGLYGPTAGDRIRLADTNLIIEIERDDASYGDEVLAGFGKTQRDGMLATSRAGRDSELDLLISNVVVLDPVLGVRKTSIGIKDGRIAGLGRAGNPDNVDAIDLVVGSNTGLITAEGLIATAGTVDSHVHVASTSLIDAALSAGTTTLVRGLAPARASVAIRRVALPARHAPPDRVIRMVANYISGKPLPTESCRAKPLPATTSSASSSRKTSPPAASDARSRRAFPPSRTASCTSGTPSPSS